MAEQYKKALEEWLQDTTEHLKSILDKHGYSPPDINHAHMVQLTKGMQHILLPSEEQSLRQNLVRALVARGDKILTLCRQCCTALMDTWSSGTAPKTSERTCG